MNILFVTGMFARSSGDYTLGGMAKAVYKSARGMQEKGESVKILTISDSSREWRYRGIDVISVRAEQAHKIENPVSVFFTVLGREYRIEKAILELDKVWHIDLIQYTGWFGIGSLHNSRKIPAIMRVSSYTSVQLAGNYSKEKEKVFHFFEKMAARNMNMVFAPGKIMAKKMEEDIKRKVFVIETPYMEEKIEQDDSVFRRIVGDRRYLLFFGRMSPDKGIYLVRDVIPLILREYDDISFVFAGVGTVNQGEKIEDELMSAAGEYVNRIIFCGNLSYKYLQTIIQRAELILMPSLMDNFPNSCAEAMYYGKIVIGSMDSSLEQFIQDGKNGLLIENGDFNSLYEKIKQYFELSEAEKQEMSNAAQEKIKFLNLEKYSNNMKRIYEKVIAIK